MIVSQSKVSVRQMMVWEKESNAHYFRVISPHPGIDGALFSSALDLCASALFKKWAIRHG